MGCSKRSCCSTKTLGDAVICQHLGCRSCTRCLMTLMLLEIGCKERHTPHTKQPAVHILINQDNYNRTDKEQVVGDHQCIQLPSTILIDRANGQPMAICSSVQQTGKHLCPVLATTTRSVSDTLRLHISKLAGSSNYL